jgi:chemotaxis protein CheZ
MAVQRKVFRIEETFGMGPAPAESVPDSPRLHEEMIAELRAVKAMLATGNGGAGKRAEGEARKLKIELDVIGEAIRQTKQEIVSLQDQGFDGSRVARVSQELHAVLSATERATQQILEAAEEIEDVAGLLGAALKNVHEQGMAQDIQQRITQIFEACNFHDLTGQRINKTIATMRLVEDHIARMTEIWGVIERFSAIAAADNGASGGLLNGPKLDNDAGHSSQDDIDALFH